MSDIIIIPLSPNDLRAVIREEVERAVRQPSKAAVEQPTYLTVSQASELYEVSKSHLYHISSKRAVSTRRVGKSVQFDAQELEGFFNQKTKKSLNAIDAGLKKHGVFPALKGGRRA